MSQSIQRDRRRGLVRWLLDPLCWSFAALLLLAAAMPLLAPLFAAVFPELDRPVYTQDSFVSLLGAHVGLVAASSAAAIAVGASAGWFVTRPAGREFRPLVEMLVAAGQTVPPVAVLAVCAPLIGFGAWPALIALALYGVLPVLRGTVAGLESVPTEVLEAARGQGMTDWQLLRNAELPLALPALLAGIRTSVVVNIGTAAIASTVGARTLGSPIIIGLAGFNTAYVVQGAVLVGGLALIADSLFERIGRHQQRWRAA